MFRNRTGEFTRNNLLLKGKFDRHVRRMQSVVSSPPLLLRFAARLGASTPPKSATSAGWAKNKKNSIFAGQARSVAADEIRERKVRATQSTAQANGLIFERVWQRNRKEPPVAGTNFGG